VPLNVELKLEVWDSPNSAGVVIDAVRCVKLALDNKLSGSLFGPASYFMKSPPEQYFDDVAREKTEEFIATYGKAVDLGGNGKKPTKKDTAKIAGIDETKTKSRIATPLKKKPVK
jgi:myo-inositol-1-phosphate synthase